MKKHIYVGSVENTLLLHTLISRHLDNCPPRKITPLFEFGFGSRLGLVLELGDNQTITLDENCQTPTPG